MDDGMNAGSTSGFPMGGFFLGILVGAALGGVAALLLAPKAGIETREMVRNRFNQMKDVVRSGAQDMKQTAQEMREQAR
jgi:gas vesicle protein